MKHLIRKTIAVVVLCASVAVQAQVKLRLSSERFTAYEPIKIMVVNEGSQPISVCVSQQWIPKPNDDVGVATTPFIFQGQNGRKWVTVLNGVDVGPRLRYALTIDAHKSQEFQFQANGRGKARFILHYVTGDNGSVCEQRRARKTATSPTFTLLGQSTQ